MKLNIVPIGNSQGLRLPKSLLVQCGIKDFVDIQVKDDSLIIKPHHRNRASWESSFQLMSKQQDDQLLDDDFLSSSFDEDWQW